MGFEGQKAKNAIRAALAGAALVSPGSLDAKPHDPRYTTEEPAARRPEPLSRPKDLYQEQLDRKIDEILQEPIPETSDPETPQNKKGE